MKQDSSPSLEKLSPRVPWSMADSPMPLRKGDGSFRHRAKCSEVPAFRGGQRPYIFHLFFPALWHLGCLVYAWIRHQYVCAFFLIGGLKKGTKLSCFLYLKLGMLWHSCRQLPKLHVWRPSKRVWFSVWPRYSGICNAWQDELTTFFEAICGQLLDTLCAIGADLWKCGLNRFADGKRLNSELVDDDSVDAHLPQPYFFRFYSHQIGRLCVPWRRLKLRSIMRWPEKWSSPSPCCLGQGRVLQGWP